MAEGSDAVSGTMDGDKTVTYVYAVKATPIIPIVTHTLTVNWVNQKGEALAEQLVQTKQEGASYTTEQKEIDGYKFLEMAEGSDAVSGTMDGDKTVTYVYAVKATPIIPIVTVNKVWKDDGNRDGIRPASIQVQLFADGVAYGEPVTLTAESSWTYTWTGLDEMSGGQEILYTVAEVGTVEGYTASVDGFTITNTHEVKKTSISVEKVWERTSNPPEIDVIIKLLADGEEVKTLKLNEDNEWKGTFSDLPVNKDGKAITYTIEEVEVSGYTTKITGSAADGFIVTNTKKSSGRPDDEDLPGGNEEELPEQEIPLSGMEEELFEEDIPLGGVEAPETGDAGMLWALTAAVSGMGLAGLNFFPKKRKEDEE
jgi:hypothetical protein